uniref:Fibronectin type-III domain-containing protein n=1 Tax=Knipowitschia caucasica TaxID=637954 RepID=A0AAV2MR84_KNICA
MSEYQASPAELTGLHNLGLHRDEGNAQWPRLEPFCSERERTMALSLLPPPAAAAESLKSMACQSWLLRWELLILVSAVSECSSNSPPGKPTFNSCRSPDKETFTCRWVPNASDGEGTTYRLFYSKEKPTGDKECPDYRTMGRNSCFFDKNHTSVWVYYFLRVVASNAFGNTSSDVLKLDVANIVMADPPENVTLQLELSEGGPIIHVAWNPYQPRSNFGWVTPRYQARFENEDTDWIRDTGTDTHYSFYSTPPGKQYKVQVRCSLDNRPWSEWSNASFIQVPKSEAKRWPFWILVFICSAIIFFPTLCIMLIKRKCIKQWLLPPVPGPKIKGLDEHLLKNGRSEEITRVLVLNQAFPLTAPWKNQIEDYLVVCDNNLLLVEDQKYLNRMVVTKQFPSDANIDKEKLILQNDVDPKAQTQDTRESVDELNRVNKEKAQSVHLPLQNGYVDIPKLDVDRRHMDYSSVIDVTGEHTIVLEMQNNAPNCQKVHLNEKEDKCLSEDYISIKEVQSEHMSLLQDPCSINNKDCGKQEATYANFITNGYVDNTF